MGCVVSAGSVSVNTRSCDVRLSASEAARRAEYESPLSRADDAEKNGNLLAAIDLLAQAIKASESFENVCAGALCRRAELLNQLGRWQEAFSDASEAVKLSSGLARAHAARGRAAMKLDLLAEATSSWEAAEVLGGVPEASSEAEKCRQLLEEYFAKAQAGRDSNIRGNSSQEGAEGPESS